MLKIYLLEHPTGGNGYDSYDACVVVALDEWHARRIHPSEKALDPKVLPYDPWKNEWAIEAWLPPADVEKIKVTYLGEAQAGLEAGCILGSFNAG